MVNDFDLPTIRRQLDALRRQHGASSTVGSCCSNLIEQLENLQTYVRPAWAKDERQTLPWLIAQQHAALSAALSLDN